MRPIRPQRHLVLALLLAGCVSRPAAPPRFAIAPLPAVAPPSSLAQAMLRTHAIARASVGLPPLAWSAGLAADAQRWADTLARSGRFEHERQDREGENLWAGTHGAFRYDEMAGYWLAERRNFVSPANWLASRTGNWKDVGHYSQIVWRGTARLGCAVASNHARDVLVCRYDPPGNVEGERAY